MKTSVVFSLSLAFLAPLALSAAPKAAKPVAAKAEAYAVNPAASKVTWEGRKKIGSGHQGELSIKSGKLIVTGEKLTGGEFEIDMASLKNTDITDEANNKKLVGHLRSDDFFSVDKYPTSKLVITKVEPGKDGKQQITGDLTIKGKTDKVTFPAEVTVNKDGANAKANITIDRTKYDVRYNSGKYFPNLGDKIINDDFMVNVELAAKK